MKQLSNYGKLGFPHFINYTTAKKVEKYCGEFEEWNGKEKVKVKKYLMVMQQGEYHFICNPDNLFTIGDTFMHPYYKILSYKITEVIEQREAKGDWVNQDFTPVYQHCKVEIV